MIQDHTKELHPVDRQEIKLRTYVNDPNPSVFFLPLLGILALLGGLILFAWVTREQPPIPVIYVTVVIGGTPEPVPTGAPTPTALPMGELLPSPTFDPLVGVPYCYDSGVDFLDTCVPRYAPTMPPTHEPTYPVCTEWDYNVPIEILQKPCRKEFSPAPTSMAVPAPPP